MYQFGQKSQEKLKQLNYRLQQILLEAIQIIDFSITEGHRDEETQNDLYDQGLSKLQFPDSKHNSYPSMAVDIAPYPIDFDDHYRFIYLAGVIKAVAHRHGVKIRWGGNWDGDDIIIRDQSFNDLVHFEILED
jgi:peptidoglycan L-alanyl-D-glutamate endopeptidase CwlK